MNGGIAIPRLRLLASIFLFLFLISWAHVAFLQTYRSAFLRQKGSQQYHVTITQHPPRACMYDRHGDPLALNTMSYAAFIVPSMLENKKETLAFLAQHFPTAYDKMIKNPQRKFLYLQRHLSKQQKANLEKMGLSDIQFLCEPSRMYPVPSLGHTTGITDIDNHGLCGLEWIYEKQLSGQPTTYSLEKEARSHHYYFQRTTNVQGIDGKAVTTTLDNNLQFLAYEKLKEHVQTLHAVDGCVVITNPRTGEVLTMATYPDFDPNESTPSDLSLTKNKICTETREFGSVIKVFPALAAIEEGIVTPETPINCENTRRTKINGMPITTWKSCGILSYADVIRYSNNIGTSKVALKLGTKLYDYLCACGFGQRTSINFPGEQDGFITPPAKWSKASPLSLSFGYEIRATPLQLAQAWSVLANKGKLVPLRLIKDNTTLPAGQQTFSPSSVEQVRNIISLNNNTNTAYFGNIPGYHIMGKTGTAYLVTDGKYDKKRSLYTFAALVEKDDYQRVIVTSIREPAPQKKKLYASTAAVPLFKKIAEAMLVYDQIV